MLAKRVQRLKELEVLYSELAGNRSAAVVAEMQLQQGRGGGGDVLEEGVGQDSKYLTVIDRETGMFGLYPIAWVERE